MTLFNPGLYDAEFERQHIRPYLEELDRIFVGIREGFRGPFHIPFITAQDAASAMPHEPLHTQQAIQLIRNDLARIQFLLFSNMSKCVNLANGLVGAYNQSNYFVWVLLGRAAIEQCAVLHYFVLKLRAMSLCRTEFTLKEICDLEDILIRYSHGTRFDWDALVFGHAPQQAPATVDRRRAVNVLTAIEKLAKAGPEFVDIRLVYDYFSDFCHPVMGSHLLITDVPEDPDCHDRICISPTPGPETGELVMYSTLAAIVLCFRRTVNDLQYLAEVREYWVNTLLSGMVTVRISS